MLAQSKGIWIFIARHCIYILGQLTDSNSVIALGCERQTSDAVSSDSVPSIRKLHQEVATNQVA